MSLMGLVVFPSFFLCFLVLAYAPHPAHASSRALNVKNDVVGDPPGQGLCASTVIAHGYKCQEFDVTTKDGFILSLQRIPAGRAENKGAGSTKKQPVIIQHGVMVDGMIWFLNGPEQNLPFILADCGFDVWIVNTRGTRYSRRHISRDPSSQEFWDWCFDDLSAYELPAIFDFVYNQTGQKINYVGHSMGTLMAFTAFSEKKLMNQVKSAALLSPIAFLSHMKTVLGDVAAKSLLTEAFTLLRIPEFDPVRLPPIKEFVKSLCNSPGADCGDILSAVTGPNCCLPPSPVDILMSHGQPQPTSTKTLGHLAQIVRYRNLAKFNYQGPSTNMEHYGSIFPPVYNLTNIPRDLPLFLSYGGQDALADVEDVQNLIDRLKSHDANKLNVQFIKDYAHADYVMAVNAKERVYNDVVSFFKRQV
ncbi:hypothetical protein RIF29_19591 [Crotalaria pallida]|uniref:Lipase n=1 Tax=Crotalaria pallida TaxID=3830 RepID=A0AAN9F212_CROPI